MDISYTFIKFNEFTKVKFIFRLLWKYHLNVYVSFKESTGMQWKLYRTKFKLINVVIKRIYKTSLNGSNIIVGQRWQQQSTSSNFY